MSFPRRTRWWLGASMALGLALAAPAAGQTTEERALERRLEFRAAQEAYEAAESALTVVEAQFAAALREVDRARRANDENALERAYAEALTRSIPVSDRRQSVEAAGVRFREARQALIDVLILRQQELLADFDVASNRAERDGIDILLRDNSLELERLEAEAEEALTTGPIVMPNVAFDNREGPNEIRFKARILERAAADVDSVIVSVENQIQGLRDRLQRERTSRDFRTGLDRFGDRADLTVSGPPTTDPTVQASDSTAVGGLPVSLEERVEALEAILESLELRRDELLLRAQMFRERIRRRG